MIRQLWDESRHAMMGELGFISIGINWREIPITWAWSYQLNTKCTPQERHAILFFIEQSSSSEVKKERKIGLNCFCIIRYDATGLSNPPESNEINFFIR